MTGHSATVTNNINLDCCNIDCVKLLLRQQLIEFKKSLNNCTSFSWFFFKLLDSSENTFASTTKPKFMQQKMTQQF